MDSILKEAHAGVLSTITPEYQASEDESRQLLSIAVEVIQEINNIRAKTGAEPLILDLDLTKQCIIEAETMCYSDGTMQVHRGLGQIACTGRINSIQADFSSAAAKSMDHFMRLRVPRLTEKSRLISKILWMSSTKIGMGQALKSNPTNREYLPKVLMILRFDPPMPDTASPLDFQENIGKVPLNDIWMQRSIENRRSCHLSYPLKEMHHRFEL